MRVVLDTNILVSAALTPGGACAEIVRLTINGLLHVLIDERILTEYREVLSRPKLGFSSQIIGELISIFTHQGERINVGLLSASLPDPDDIPFLEVAFFGQGTIITGNMKHFPPELCCNVPILMPAQLTDILRRS
ncbi:MAG: putative toxin-antitoxin system toxin component, PIN family [bacterium]|nr:putative toxin-antitoxin system toxin component, PIN family [bacterium]